MHFPVFAYSGNFEDLSISIIEKYAKASLTDSSALFEKIEAVVNEESLYLDFDLKLNTVAKKLNQSIHHISQAINKKAKVMCILSHKLIITNKKRLPFKIAAFEWSLVDN
jgi:predicted DNA-binding protein YlxM (UPF0122 family)